jgi:hypothetical protein
MAQLAFMRETGLMVEQCGFFEYGDRMGASPDGLTSDGGVLELKVPFGLRNEKEAQFKTLQAQPHYYCQVQMEMLATGRKHAYFAQYVAPKGDPLSVDYVPEQINIERVYLDEKWIDDVLPQLDGFYKRLLAELDNPAHIEPLRVEIETPESGELIAELEYIKQRKKNDSAREKEIINELVVMANNKNALIHGHKLTLAKNSTRIDYKKALEDMLPDADLSGYESEVKGSWRLS